MPTESPVLLSSQREQQGGNLEENNRRVGKPLGKRVTSERLNRELGNDFTCDSDNQECRSSGNQTKDQLIDSRSILCNKEKLRRFWEQRMEVELKLNSGSPASDERQKSGIKMDDINNNHEEPDEHSNSSRCRRANTSPDGEISAKPNGKGGTQQNRSCGGHQDQPLAAEPSSCHKATETLEQQDSIELFDCEEQFVNEEFSSPNSSFGPVSISQQHDALGQQLGQVVDGDSNCELGDSDDGANSLAQSGSVSTVINANHIDLEAQDNDGSDIAKDVNGEDDGSNIGVAFESLQFDTEVRSSKHERLDDNLLMLCGGGGQRQSSPSSPAKQQQVAPQMPKFDASEVKSVCGFITAAISDTARQVERMITHPKSISIGQDATDYRDKRPSESSGSPHRHRATFVQKQSPSPPERDLEQVSPSRTLDWARVESADIDDDEESTTEPQGEVPKADLSSIFEASVRREIERFESANTMIRRQSMGSQSVDKCTDHKGGLTEWRIAEEIRLFNEREMELKRRLKSANQQPQLWGAGLASQSRLSSSHEAIVRNGKTFQIPKAKGLNVSTQQQPMQFIQTRSSSSVPTGASKHLTKSIRLTTRATPVAGESASGPPQHPATMISMHKFISSGGKRFVYSSSAAVAFPSGSSGGGNQQVSSHHQSNSALQNGNQFTKSMSNLTTIGYGKSDYAHQQPPANRDADYKAADSLKCKETPNVEPGTAKKVIETFKRLSSSEWSSQQQHVAESARNNSQFKTHQVAAANKFQICNGGSGGVGAASPPVGASTQHTLSAEMKIQEELRDMRAREAELRDQQRRWAARLAKPTDQTSGYLPADDEDESASIADNYEADLERICAIDRQQLAANNNHDDANDNQSLANGDELSQSSDSLYPIKQAIDSFRRLNTSQSTSSESRSKSPFQVTNSGNNNVSKIQQKLQLRGQIK